MQFTFKETIMKTIKTLTGLVCGAVINIIPFHFLGVVREFPTAPKDSFLIANADYIARQTGIKSRKIVLMRTNGKAAQLAARASRVVSSTILAVWLMKNITRRPVIEELQTL